MFKARSCDPCMALPTPVTLAYMELRFFFAATVSKQPIHMKLTIYCLEFGVWLVIWLQTMSLTKAWRVDTPTFPIDDLSIAAESPPSFTKSSVSPHLHRTGSENGGCNTQKSYLCMGVSENMPPKLNVHIF